jgi:hypothetical protein
VDSGGALKFRSDPDEKPLVERVLDEEIPVTDPFAPARLALRAATTPETRAAAVSTYAEILARIGLEHAEAALLTTVGEEGANLILNRITALWETTTS